MYKNYKKYFIYFISTALLIIASLILAGDLIIRYCKLSKMSSDVYHTNRWFEKKEELFANMPQDKNKIVFISGSNTLFGINAQQVEDALNIPSFNYGLHATYSHVLFDIVKDKLKAGDIAILPFEIYEFRDISNVNNSSANLIISYYKNIYKNLSLLDKLYCIRFLYFEYSFLQKERIYKQFPVNEGPYSINCWNSRGDIICNRTKQSDCATPGVPSFDKSNLSYVKYNRIEAKKLIKNLKAKNVKVFIMPQCLMENKFNNETLEIYNKILHSFGVPVLMGVDDSIYSQDLFYDNPFHLNSKGAEYRTNQIIQALKRYGY